MSEPALEHEPIFLREPRTFTQADVDRIATKARDDGRRVAYAALAERCEGLEERVQQLENQVARLVDVLSARLIPTTPKENPE